MVLLLSDGFEEAAIADEQLFGTERILEVVREHRDRPAQEIVSALSASVHAFLGETPRADDITVIVAKAL